MLESACLVTCEKSCQILAYERRESPRFRMSVFVRPEGGHFCEYRGDIGIGGFGFEADAPIETGAKLEVFFLLPGSSDWIMLEGTVLACSSVQSRHRAHCRFHEIDFENERLLARFLDENCPLS